MGRYFNFLYVVLFFLLTACEEELEMEELGDVILTEASTITNTANQNVHLHWIYVGDATQLLHFRIEYSLQHGQWVSVGQAANTENDLVLTFPSTTFLSNNFYAWRVVAVSGNEEVASCYKETIEQKDATFGRLQLHTSNFTTNAILEFDYNFSTIGLAAIQQAGVHPVVQKKVGANWVEVIDYFGTSFAQTERFSLPMNFEVGQTYRVYLHGAELYYGQGNSVEFTYANPHTNACCGDMALVEPPQITNLGISNSMSYRGLNLTWTHPNPSVLTGFKVQYSAQHGPWVDFQTVSNQTLSLVYSYEAGQMLPYSVFMSNMYYRWRVVALTDNLQVPSCASVFKTEMGNQERNYLGIYLSVEQDTNVPTFKAATPFGTVTGAAYKIEQYSSGQWVAVGTPVALSTLTQAGVSFIPNNLPVGRYKISVSTASGTRSNIIEFYTNDWPINPNGC